MSFDFTTLYDRRGKDALAVDIADTEPSLKPKEGFDVIPMWIADMNFATAPSVTRAVVERLDHPLFGYFETRDEYYDSIIWWQKARNGVTGLEHEHIGYENGVLGGLVSALRAVCATGDKVLVHSPTYIGFTGSIEGAGYRIVTSDLKPDQAGVMRMDLADMEAKIRENDIRALVFCSPHNPCGRVWERAEIEAVVELCARLDVTIISDEIWSDLTLPGHKHIPTQSVSDEARRRTIALYAPSKTFNLAGLIGSYHIIYNEALRRRVLKESAATHYNSMNVLSMHALMGAYSEEGAAWLDELREVLGGNVAYACDFIDRELDGVSVRRPEGTYMLFVDCGEYCRTNGRTLDEVKRAGIEVGVLWQDGRPFHGASHLRMNLALPRDRMIEAFDRLKKHVFV